MKIFAIHNGLICVINISTGIDVIAARWRDQPNHEFNSSVVKGTVRDLEFHDIIRVAKLINSRGYHTVLIQFEFGMLYGEALVCALRALHAPVLLITQHTITRVMLEYQHSLARSYIMTFLCRAISTTVL